MPVPSAHQTQRQQSRARSESTPTVATTPTDKLPKEPLFSPTPSPHDHPRRPSLQQPLPSEQHELRTTESRAMSQKRKSTDCHDAAGRGYEYDMDSSGRADGGNGSELMDEGPSPVFRCSYPIFLCPVLFLLSPFCLRFIYPLPSLRAHLFCFALSRFILFLEDIGINHFFKKILFHGIP